MSSQAAANWKTRFLFEELIAHLHHQKEIKRKKEEEMERKSEGSAQIYKSQLTQDRTGREEEEEEEAKRGERGGRKMKKKEKMEEGK